MAGDRVRCYLDIAETWPDKTLEELEEMIKKDDEENKKLTEWPKM